MINLFKITEDSRLIADFWVKTLINRMVIMINQNNRKPKQKTLDNVFSVVKAKAGMNRKSICSELNHTPYSVDLCLEVLVDSGKLLRRFIRMSGPYKVWAYEVK